MKTRHHHKVQGLCLVVWLFAVASLVSSDLLHVLLSDCHAAPRVFPGRRGAFSVAIASLFTSTQLTPCAARETIGPETIAALLENGPQLQRAADKLVLELRPSIVEDDWKNFQTTLAQSEQEILEPVQSIVAQSPGHNWIRNPVGNIQESVRMLKAAASKSDKRQALRAWDDTATVINQVMFFANEVMPDNTEFKDVQEFALVTEDADMYLAGCWAALVNGTSLESEFMAAMTGQPQPRPP